MAKHPSCLQGNSFFPDILYFTMCLKYFDFQSIMQERSFVKKNILIIKVFLTIEDSFSICGKQSNLHLLSPQQKQPTVFTNGLLF